MCTAILNIIVNTKQVYTIRWSSTWRLINLSIVITAVLLWTPASMAQLERGDSVDITANAGFQQKIQLDRWNPLTITVRNAGAAFRGYLEVVAADSRQRVEFQTRYRQPLELARDARKRLQFTIYISRITEPLNIRVVSDAGVVASTPVELRSIISQQRFIVALARDVNVDYLNDREDRRSQVVYPLPGFLPDHWQGYDGVEAVILHRFALDSLTPRQYTALTKWITAGGTLLVSGGYDTAILRSRRIAELLPAPVIGTQQLDAQTALHTALGEFDEPLILNQPLGIATVDMPIVDTANVNNSEANGETNLLHHHNGVPLVVEHRYGRGAVVLLTFDIASGTFTGWPGMRQFMYRILRISAVKPITIEDQQKRQQQTSLLKQLTRQRAIGFPGHGTVIAFTTFYLVVLALFSLHGSNTSWRRWNVALIFAIPIVFSLAVIGLFHQLLFPQAPSLASVAVIKPVDNSALAEFQLQLGMHSTRADHLQVRYTGARPMLRTGAEHRLSNRPFIADQKASLATWVFDQGNTSSAIPLDAKPYTTFNASGKDMVEFSVSGSYQSNAILEFHNTSGRTITDLWAITRNQVFELGTVSDEQRVSAELRDGMHLGRHRWRDNLQLAHSGNRVPVTAVESILDGKFGAYRGDLDTDVLLVGFTSNPWTINNQHWNHIDLTMMVWQISQQAERR